MKMKKERFRTSHDKKMAFSTKMVTLMILLLIFLNGSWTSGVGVTDRDWKEGDILTYDFTYKYEQELISSNGKLSTRSSSESVNEAKMNISSVDEESKNYKLVVPSTDLSRMEKETWSNFNASLVGERLATLFVDYLARVTNDENGRAHLIGMGHFPIIFSLFDLDIGGGAPYLVNPDWKAVNEQFLSIWIENRKLPSNTYLQYTLGDLWKDAVSFKLMGKSSLKEARQALTDETHEWTMEYDLSGVAEERIYTYTGNVATGEFQTFNIFKGKLEIEYTKGGTLKRIFLTSNQEIDGHDGGTRKTSISFEVSLDQGGGLLGGKIDFSPISVLLGLGTMVVTTLLFRKKKKTK